MKMFYRLLGHIIQYRFRPGIKHLILHITRRCNSRCKTCFVDMDLKNNNELSLDEIKQLAKNFTNLCFLDIGGGEPFLREDLVEICQAFDVSQIGIPTNGIFKDVITKTIIDIKKRIKSNLMISLSLDGLEATNDFIRGEGHFQQALATYEHLRRIKGVGLKINTVLCNRNIQELGLFIDFVRKLNPDFHSIIFIRGNPRDKGFRLPSIHQLYIARRIILENAYYYMKKTAILNNLFFKRYYQFLINRSLKTLEYKKAMFRCLAGQAHCVIYPEGDVSVCELLDPIGNIRKTDFWSIWNSAKTINLRQKISRGHCYCTHNCVILDNFIFNLPFSLL